MLMGKKRLGKGINSEESPSYVPFLVSFQIRTSGCLHIICFILFYIHTFLCIYMHIEILISFYTPIHGIYACVYMHIYNEYMHVYICIYIMNLNCFATSILLIVLDLLFFFFIKYFILREHFVSKHKNSGVPAMARWVKNPTAVAQLAVEVRVPSLAEGVKVSVVATAAPQIQTLAWELLFAIGVAIKFK